MRRCLSILAAALAVTLPVADMAQADHNRRDGALRLRIGPIEFRAPARVITRSDRRRGVVVTRSFPYDGFEDDEVFPFVQGEDGRWRHLPDGRAGRLDRELGAALDAMRRDLALRQGYEAPRGGAVAVSKLPRPAPRRTPIIEEEAVLGPVPPVAVPVTDVGQASAADVTTYGADAFALLSKPDALGLPDLPGGGQYYVLNGRIVTLDAEAQRALTVAALEAALQ